MRQFTIIVEDESKEQFAAIVMAATPDKDGRRWMIVRDDGHIENPKIKDGFVLYSRSAEPAQEPHHA